MIRKTYAYIVVADKEWQGIAGVFSAKSRATAFSASKNKHALEQVPSGITYHVETWVMN